LEGACAGVFGHNVPINPDQQVQRAGGFRQIPSNDRGAVQPAESQVHTQDASMTIGYPMQVSAALRNNFVDKRILGEVFACILIRIAYLEQYDYRAPD
jgi:hypothetical protein